MKFFLKTIAVSLVFLLRINTALFSQEEMLLHESGENKNSVSLGLGLQTIDTKDMLESPMIYSGQMNILSFSYQHNGQTVRHIIEISANRGDGLNAATKNTIGINFINGKYSCFHYITSLLDGRLSFYAGGTLNHISFEKQFNIASGFMNIASFDESTSLNLSMMGEYSFNRKDHLRFGLYTPLLAYVLRPNYSLFPRDAIAKYNTPIEYFLGEGHVRIVNDILGLSSWITVEKSISSMFALRLNYNFTFYKIKSPAESAVVSNSLNINLAYLF